MKTKHSVNNKSQRRARRSLRLRSKILELKIYRLSVFKSNKHLYAYLIDLNNQVVAASSTLSKEFKEHTQNKNFDNTEKSTWVGESIAKKAISKDVNKVVFDRSGYKYHGRIKELAESARKTGLQF